MILVRRIAVPVTLTLTAALAAVPLACSDDDDTSGGDTDTDADTDTDTDADTDADTDTDTDTDADTDTTSSTGGLGGFGDPCESDEDCATDVCHEFGSAGKLCTYYCDDDADCPEGSQGQKCNNQGVCRP